jgi:predicted AAA+ superfamily ATPase
MALSEAVILRQNPWWTTPGWQATDPHLALLAEQPARLPARIVQEIDLGAPGLHTLRGPRQVGKSTDLKLLVQRALEEGREAQQVFYLQVDLLYGQPITELDATVDAAKRLARAGPGSLVLLDEVTALDGWDVGIKAMWDTGMLRGDTVVATGSSAAELYRGGVAERWPGRRGAGEDHLVLPQSFADFSRALFPTIPASPCLRAGELPAPSHRHVLDEIRMHLPQLTQAFDLYLRFGGLPAAVAEAVAGRQSPSQQTMRIIHDSLVREVQRRGAGEVAAQAMLECIARALGSRVSWTALAEDMGVPLGMSSRARRGPPSGTTVRDYVEFLAAGYLVMVLYAWKADLAGNDLAREKKLYLGDPLLYWASLDHVGLGENVPALAENAIAIALLRRYEPAAQLYRGFVEPGAVHLWRSRRGGEIDFLAGSRREVDAVEVRYHDRVDRRVFSGLRTAFPGRPAIVASKTELEVLDERSALVPAPVLAWALG